MVDTLSNDRTKIQEASVSNCSGFNSIAIPEATVAFQQNSSQTGVSLDYAHDESKKWYVLRATYGREKKAFEYISKFGTIAYLPTQKNELKKGCEIVIQEKSLIPNILFVYTTSEDIVRYIRGKDSLSFLRFYYNRTSANCKGKNDPLTIPVLEMDNFIHTLNIEGTKQVDKSYVNIKTGDIVQVTDGICKGVIGKVGRVNRHTGIIVELQGLCCLMTAYIPKAFIVKIDNNRTTE